MNKNIKTNSKAGKRALGFIFSVVLLDVIGLAILIAIGQLAEVRMDIDDTRRVDLHLARAVGVHHVNLLRTREQ